MTKHKHMMKTRVKAAVTTKTRVMVATAAVVVAAAAMLGAVVLGQGSVKIVSPVSGATLRGTQAFDAVVKAPNGYDTYSVTFTELPQQRSFVAGFMRNAGIWRANVDTTVLTKGKHTAYAQAVFVARPRSTPTATQALTRPLTVPSTSTAGLRQVVTRSATISFTVNNDPVIAVSSVSVTPVTSDVDGAPGNVIGGASNVVLAKFAFTSPREESELRKLRVSIDSPAAVSSVSLYDGNVLISGPSAVSVGSYADFSIANLRIMKGATKTLTVKGNLRPVGPSGVASGASARVVLASPGAGLEIRGVQSRGVYNSFAQGSVHSGPHKNMRKSLPTVSLVGLPTTVLANGVQTVMRFTVSANASGDVAMKGLAFEVINATSAGAIDLGDSGVRRVGSPSFIPESSAIRPICTSRGTCVVTVRFQNEEVLAAGTSRTYELRLRVANTKAGDAISTRLLADTGYGRGSLTENNTNNSYFVGGTQSNFTWSDMSAVPHSAALGGSADWGNGIYVKMLPTATATLSR